MTISKFEDLDIWTMSREITKMVYELTKGESFKHDWSLKDQMRRSTVSIMSNIAEGFERQTNKEFVQFLFIAKGSAGELRSLLYVSGDMDYFGAKEIELLFQKTITVSKSISSLIKYLNNSKSK